MEYAAIEGEPFKLYETQINTMKFFRSVPNKQVTYLLNPAFYYKQRLSFLFLCVPFCWRQWVSSLPGLRMLDPPLGPQSTLAEILRASISIDSMHFWFWRRQIWKSPPERLEGVVPQIFNEAIRTEREKIPLIVTITFLFEHSLNYRFL